MIDIIGNIKSIFSGGTEATNESNNNGKPVTLGKSTRGFKEAAKAMNNNQETRPHNVSQSGNTQETDPSAGVLKGIKKELNSIGNEIDTKLEKADNILKRFLTNAKIALKKLDSTLERIFKSNDDFSMKMSRTKKALNTFFKDLKAAYKTATGKDIKDAQTHGEAAVNDLLNGDIQGAKANAKKAAEDLGEVAGNRARIIWNFFTSHFHKE